MSTNDNYFAAPIDESYKNYVLTRVKHHLKAADFFWHEAQELDVSLKSRMDTNDWPPVAVDERDFAILAANFHATMANLFATQIGQWYEYDGEWLNTNGSEYPGTDDGGIREASQEQ